MIVYVENPKESAKRKRKKILEVISKFSNHIGYKVNTKKLTVLPLSELTMEISNFWIKNIPFTTPPKKKVLKYKSNTITGICRKTKTVGRSQTAK